MTDILTRSASLAPTTFNRDAGTVDAIISTGAPVQRRDARGAFSEILSIVPGSFQIRAGAARVPLLDSHGAGSIQSVLGSAGVTAVSADGIHARLHLADAKARDLVESGALTGVSIGYRVDEWQEADGGRTRTAAKWTLHEISLVPIPADAGATLRSEPMPEPTTTTADPAPVQTRAADNLAIRSLAATLHLGTPFADSQIDAGATVEAARAAALTELERRSAAGQIRVHQIGQSGDDPAVVLTRQADALAHRMSPSIALPDAARQFAAMGFADHARALLTQRGEPGLAFMSKETLLQRATTTGDLPNLLQNTGNRVLTAAYQAAPSPLKALCRQATAQDFRARTILKLGEFDTLDRVPENGEITQGGVVEAAESYSLATYTKTFALTRNALINDDLGAFSGITAAMGRAAAETENGLLVKLLLTASGAGPTMGDGVALFNAAHGSLAGTGAALAVATLDTARQAMRVQKGVDGISPINATPRYILVSPANETTAQGIVAPLYATSVDDVNPFAGRLEVMVEPRLTGGAWYLWADPAELPCLEYAYLSAAPGPQMDSRPGWDVLGMEFRVYLDFGAGAVDWRGCYRNAGA